eukprot:g403.t1
MFFAGPGSGGFSSWWIPLKLSAEEMQLPCAFFTPDGERIEALQGLLRSPVLFFLENGQWMWPAVRIGFQQNVTGLPDVYLTTLSLRPAVFEVRNFMSSQEADEVMAIGAQQGLHSSKDTGTYYHAHMDWTELDFYPDQRHIWMDSHFGHFDRLATLFWYLNDVQEGGETIFPKHGQPICAPRSLGGPAARFCTGARDPDMSSCVKGLKVRPRKGTAVLWYNFLATGRGDRNSLHAGCPVGPNETKWSGNKWVRNKPWGTPGHWMPGHPALKRYGWRADDEDRCLGIRAAAYRGVETGSAAVARWQESHGAGEDPPAWQHRSALL